MDNQVLLFVVVGVFIVVVIVFGVVRNRAQQKKSEEFASSRGWRFTKRDDSLEETYPELFPLGQGTGRTFLNVMSFDAGALPAQSFDYRYTEVDSSSSSSSETSQTTHKYHVVAVRLPQPLPLLMLRPRRKLDAIEGKIVKPISFESTAFNDAWFVQGEHPPAAHDVIHPRMMEWLLTVDSGRTLNLQDDTLFTYAKGIQKLEHIDGMVTFLTDFVSHVPAHVWQKADGEYPRPQRVRTTLNLNKLLTWGKQSGGGQPQA